MKHGLTFCWSKNFEAFGLDLGRKALIAHDTVTHFIVINHFQNYFQLKKLLL